MLRKNEASWIESRKRWQINVQRDGVRRTFTSTQTGRRGKLDAERKADVWLTTAADDSGRTTAGTLISAYVEAVTAKTGTANATKEERNFRLYITPVIGRKKMQRITDGDLQDCIDNAYADHHLAKKTLQGVRASLMAWLKWCRRHGKTTLFVDDLTIPRGARAVGKTILPPDALSTLFRSDATTWRNRERPEPLIWAIRFAVVTGLRPGELIGLQRGDISGNLCTISRSINSENELTRGKNDNAVRTVQLSQTAQWILGEQLAANKTPFSVYVFSDTDGGPLTQKKLYTRWRAYCRHHGITDGTALYELRHTWVSINDEMPDSLKKIIMGHSKSMDTTGTYGHEKQGDRAKAAGYIDDAFAPYVGKHGTH